MKITEVIGGPIIAYHGTTDNISQFRPLTHFGTEKAARDRMDYKKNATGKIYKVQLGIHNPFTIKDFPGIHYDRVYAFDLRDKKLLSQEEMENITMLQDPAELRAALIAKVRELGYDGFVYKNRYEDKGNISYVILDSSQVKVLDVTSVGQVEEAFDQPYRLKWEAGDYGDVDAYAKLDDGNYLSIMFNKGFSQGTKEEAWSVEFFRNNSQEVTGEGDAQRVFATVLSAIQKFIKKYKPNRIIFSASKEVEQGQNAQSRARLYDSLVQRYARAWGFRAFRADTGNKVIYELSRIKPVGENFADGKVKGKSSPGRVKRAGASCTGSVTDLRAKAKKYGGEKGKMYHWCANMKGGKK